MSTSVLHGRAIQVARVGCWVRWWVWVRSFAVCAAQDDKSAVLLFPKFVRKRARVINLPQRFGDGGRIDRDGSRLFVGVNAIEHERLNIAVENDADEFVHFVHDRAAAVAADDVGVRDKVIFRFRIERGLLVDPALREVERRLVRLFLFVFL
jgi:hypothetical protein